jgi:hypothetical protein
MMDTSPFYPEWVGIVSLDNYCRDPRKTICHVSQFRMEVDYSEVRSGVEAVYIGLSSGIYLDQKNPPYDLTYTTRGGGPIAIKPCHIVTFSRLDGGLTAALEWVRDESDVNVANGLREFFVSLNRLHDDIGRGVACFLTWVKRR